LAAFSVFVAARSRQLSAVHLFLLTGLVAGLGVGKWGAGESYFLSAIVASSILAGQAAGSLLRRGGPVAWLVPLALLIQCTVSAHGFVSASVALLPDRGLQAAALAPEPTRADLERGYGIVTRLRETPGDGLVEDPGFSLAAGKPIIGNATHLRNLHQAGLYHGDSLVADLLARRYHSVVLDAELYPEPVLRAIGGSYFLYDTVRVYQAEQKVFLPGSE
jgi:hypothetical protein